MHAILQPRRSTVQGTHFDGQIIILCLCVSWYTSFKLSLRDLVIMMADRGIPLTHTTILRRVQHCWLSPERRRRTGQRRDSSEFGNTRWHSGDAQEWAVEKRAS
jgi:transposase-like protein